MIQRFPPWLALLVIAGRLLTGLLALAAVVSKPLENAVFSCVSLAAAWFFVEGGINLWHQHQEAVAQQLRDQELKRQRAEEARVRFEAAQRQKQSEADQSYMDLDLDDLSDSGAKIPLEALRTKGVQAGGIKQAGQGDMASRQAAGGMSASELDMALIEMDANAGMSRIKRA